MFVPATVVNSRSVKLSIRILLPYLSAITATELSGATEISEGLYKLLVSPSPAIAETSPTSQAVLRHAKKLSVRIRRFIRACGVIEIRINTVYTEWLDQTTEDRKGLEGRVKRELGRGKKSQRLLAKRFAPMGSLFIAYRRQPG
jgi:hypothetical protein